MKKRLCCLLAIVLLFGAGCAPKNDTPATGQTDTEVPTSRQTDTDVSGMEIRVDKVTAENGYVILDVIWSNQTEHNATYGEVFSIDRLEDGQWVACAMAEDTAFCMVGYQLNKGQKVTRTYWISPLFDVSAYGTYRFNSSCTIDGKTCGLWAEFTLEKPEIQEGATPVPFLARPVRTDGYAEAMTYPAVKLIKSEQELKDYYAAYKDAFDLERKEIFWSCGPTEIGFLDACDRYDEAFFEKNYLLFAILEEGSGSISHAVKSVAQTAEGKLSISIDSKVPEACTADMAQWHIFVELSRDVEIDTADDALLYLDGELIWDGTAVEPPKPEAVYTAPPEMLVITPEGETAVKAAGHSWSYANSNGNTTAVIADQADRPLPADCLEPICIDSKYAETVYAYAEPGQYEPTNSLGYTVKLHFDVNPASLSYTCWTASDTSREESVEYFRDNQAFYAKNGGYIYEITAAWEDTGAGYYGTASYYVYIVGGHHAVPITTE